jgi:hypothetical protein
MWWGSMLAFLLSSKSLQKDDFPLCGSRRFWIGHGSQEAQTCSFNGVFLSRVSSLLVSNEEVGGRRCR